MNKVTEEEMFKEIVALCISLKEGKPKKYHTSKEGKYFSKFKIRRFNAILGLCKDEVISIYLKGGRTNAIMALEYFKVQEYVKLKTILLEIDHAND